MSVVAFLGLGAIGLPMAINLCRAGHTVVAYDMRPERVALMQAEGAKPAATLREAVRAADTVISVLPGGKDHREIYLGADGILAQARTGMLVIDSSTSQIELAREIAAHAGRLAIDAIDAPISGGIRGAKAGKLTFMAGGSAKAIERARPILMGMAQAVIHTGDAGTGQAAKICNNLMVGINTLGMCEAFALAEKIGLDAGTLFEVAKQSSGQSWALDNLCPVPGLLPDAPSSHGYVPGGASALLLKDLQLAQAAAQQAGVASPLGAAATALYAMFCANGGGNVDSSGMINFLRGRKTEK